MLSSARPHLGQLILLPKNMKQTNETHIDSLDLGHGLVIKDDVIITLLAKVIIVNGKT